ncbi:hypothetical protein [Prosthecobacter sp.]|uniref:hypothetical protein n=1 Tax=Prosthecobacter sp. TaxID=1965333 RepID=UPI001E152424|nr:hypothetical protein [Prosthecobacter sp.]MCB1277513.1 hypothetical protein [Prosthecobacter sp.]
MSNYSQLNPELLVATVEKLSTRIGERFPKAGLFRVSKHLCNIAAESRRRVTETGRRSLWIRAAIVLLLILMVAGVVMSVSAFRIQPKTDDVTWVELVQAMESGINDIVFVGIGVFFLASLETRMRRRRILKALHELRSLAHVIDMHQLTKDPQRAAGVLVATPSSPTSDMSPDQLIRYLDYCSEMLSLVGKLAALYLQRSDDEVVLSTVDEIEGLTTGLARKIWQKLMIIHASHPAGAK